jgi:hypothetical protein
MTTVTFETWRERFEKSILVKTPEWTALQQYIGFLEQGSSDRPLSPSPVDHRTIALQLIYGSTCPPRQQDEQNHKRDAYIRKALRSITIQAESFVSNLRNAVLFDAGPVIVKGDSHAPGIDLSSLLKQYQSVAKSSRAYLALLEWRWITKERLVDRGIGLSLELERKCNIRERLALALVRLALLAHGCPEDELEDLRDPDKIRAGNFRKRQQVYIKQRDSFYKIPFPSPSADK